jgi:hypothetical protein
MSTLPVADIVRSSYADLIAHREGLVRIGIWWLLLPFALDFLAAMLASEQTAASVGLVSMAISFIGLGAIAVAWHRHILRGGPLLGPVAKVDGTVMRYVGLGFLVSLFSSVPTALAAALAIGIGGAPGSALGLSTVAIALAGLMAVILFVRLQLVFPGTAVSDPSMSLARSWQVTRGHTARLLLGLIATVLPVLLAVLLGIVAGWLFTAIGAPRFGAFVALLANHGGSWIQAPLVAAFLSYCYLWLIPTGAGPVNGAPGSP